MCLEKIAYLRRLAAKIPLIGPFFACSWKEHRLAIRDFLITVTFSTMTFWFSAALLSVLERNRDVGYGTLLSSTVQSGELFIFSVGILGPMLITVTDDSRQNKKFPAATYLIFFLVIATLFCGGFYALMKTSVIGVAGVSINKDLVLAASFWAAGLSCVLRYLTIAYSKSLTRMKPEDFTANNNEEIDAFTHRHEGERA